MTWQQTVHDALICLRPAVEDNTGLNAEDTEAVYALLLTLIQEQEASHR